MKQICQRLCYILIVCYYAKERRLLQFMGIENINCKILTIIVPAYNMEYCLRNNLQTYISDYLKDKISVLVFDNSSDDKTYEIALSFEKTNPSIFKAITKENNGYGSSVNMGMKLVESKYFKIIDADDFVDTLALENFVRHLSSCDADIVQTPYVTVDVNSGKREKINLKTQFNQVEGMDLIKSQVPFPSLHTTTIKSDFFKKNPFSLLENAYYVDEEWATYPLFFAKTVCAFDDAVYHYSIKNSKQSISLENKTKRYNERERVIKRMLWMYSSSLICDENSKIAFERVARSVGDHFTTLLILKKDKKIGRHLASEFYEFLKSEYPGFLIAIKKKYILLSLLNRLHIRVSAYNRMKKILGYKEQSSL